MIGYCTNVHAGAGFEETLTNLERYAVRVHQQVDPTTPLGLGLWLSAASINQLMDQPTECRQFADWLADRSLVPYTINAFPYGDFHGPVVKHDVYEPPWWDDRRVRYTIGVARTFDMIAPHDLAGTISTLPIGWLGGVGAAAVAPGSAQHEQLRKAASQLGVVAESLQQLERASGRSFRLCLEPEPGCALQSAADVVRFFDAYLRPQLPAALVDRYLGVCHDICHSAVMFEPQEVALATYAEAGICVGKIQVSSAIVARFDQSDAGHQEQTRAELRAFAEDRYLHQTVVRDADQLRFYEDLPQALAAGSSADQPTEWRVHFHVPLFVEKFGRLETTQDEIDDCLRTITSQPGGRCPALEVETYAWDVLPSRIEPDLASGIAQEIDWLRDKIQALDENRDLKSKM